MILQTDRFPFPMALVPPKQYLPFVLFILLSFSCVFLFSLTASNQRDQFQDQVSRIPGSKFVFIIKVLTFNRPASLARCLHSLSRAHYDDGDRIHLHVFIDHFPLVSGTLSADTDRSLNVSKQIVDFVDGFNWDFGEKVVHYRTSNAGLQAQWLESWWPSSDHEFAFVVEDDLEVSPLYYRFLKAVILKYYYNSSNFSPYVYGASLQRPRFVPGKHGNKMQLNGEGSVFLYQLVGTWGQLLFPRPWKEFRLWYDVHKAKGMKPFLEGMVTTGWYKKMGEKIWTPWFIKFIHSRGYFNLYTNFPHERALSISHRDAGVNYGKTAGPDSYLLDDGSIDPNFFELLPLNSLNWYDFCFRKVITNRMVRSSNDLGSVLPYIQKNNSVVLISLHGISEGIVRNMLCHFQKLNIQNYLLVGAASNLLQDLARRGHPVIDVGQLFKSINFQDSSIELVQESVVKAYATKKSLEHGYSTWLLDANMLPLSDDSFSDALDHPNDIVRSSRYLFVKSSSSMRKIWTDSFIYNVASQVSSLRKELSSDNNLISIAIERILQKQNIRLDSVDDMQLGLDITTVEANTNPLSTKSKFVYWSHKADLDMIRKQLEHLDLWVIDSDSSCTAVVCHHS